MALYLFWRNNIVTCFIAMFYFGSDPKTVFFPETEPQTIYVTMELPLGTSLEKTDEVSRQVEDIIKETIEPVNEIVKSVTTKVGVGKGGMFENECQPQQIAHFHFFCGIQTTWRS